jgi:hypothetical protein
MEIGEVSKLSSRRSTLGGRDDTLEAGETDDPD